MSRDGHRVRRGLVLAIALACIAALPSSASAAIETQTFRLGPVQVDGYEVLQGHLLGQTPQVDGHIVAMETDVVDADGNPIPIQRLMLHHIAFTNLSRRDNTCEQFTDWDGQATFNPMPQRFYAAGEERAKLRLPPGYGYRTRASDPWGVTYMFMNHRAETDQAYIEYTVTIDTDPAIQDLEPYWLDVENCHGDPVYNVPGTDEKGSTHTRTAKFTFPQAGRILAGGGHVHGGARRLTLTQPDCEGREIGRSVPTWGMPDHPFYNVRPILHEPGPINMSGFGTAQGIPVEAGQTVRLTSEYENSRAHTRVMGIMVVYFLPDAGVTDGCAPLPNDIVNVATDQPGRRGPTKFEVPLIGLDDDGKAVEINAPPGKLERMGKGGEIVVGDRFFSEPNVEVRKGAKLEWRFSGSELHNVTLANGPQGIGSPNLDDGRTYGRKLTRKGTYRLFCALHPVDMQERVVVRGK